jgi:hypothetical protein
VTLSRDFACGGEDLARRLADSLQVQCYDREILEAVVQAAHADRYVMERLDERTSSPVEDWVYSLVSGQPAVREDYVGYLVKVVRSIAAHGGVIVGRGAHLVLARADAFRVRVTGSLDVCARRHAEQGGLSLEQARKEVAAVNQQRAKFVKVNFQGEINDLSAYDLCLNTDRLPVPQAVELILTAMRLAGYPVPRREVQPAPARAS